MKAGWQRKKLGELIRLEYGKPLDQIDRCAEGQYPVYGANGIKDRTSKYYYDKPSIIVGRKGSAGEVNLTEEKFWPLDVTYFVTFDTHEYDLKFIFYLLLSLELTTLAKGVKPGINRNEVYSINVNVPRLVEQQRIAKVLDNAFDAITTAKNNIEKNLQSVRELFESYLQSVDAEKVPLGTLVDITTGKLDANAAIEGGQYPFFTCSKEIFAIDKYAFDCEAILLAGNNGAGDFNVKHYKGKFNAYQRTYVITANKENSILYRYLYFQMLKSLKVFKANSVGTGTKFLKLGMIKDLKMALPTISEQKAIAFKLDNLDAKTKQLETIYRRKLAALDELKKSLLHQAFNGEL